MLKKRAQALRMRPRSENGRKDLTRFVFNLVEALPSAAVCAPWVLLFAALLRGGEKGLPCRLCCGACHPHRIPVARTTEEMRQYLGVCLCIRSSFLGAGRCNVDVAMRVSARCIIWTLLES